MNEYIRELNIIKEKIATHLKGLEHEINQFEGVLEMMHGVSHPMAKLTPLDTDLKVIQRK